MKYKRGDLVRMAGFKGRLMLLENERKSVLNERTADVYDIARKEIVRDIRLSWCRKAKR